MEITGGSTDVSIDVRAMISGGDVLTGKVAADFAIWYRRDGAKISIGLSDLGTLESAHSDGGIYEISDGWYRLDMPDAAFATGANRAAIGGSVAGGVVVSAPIAITTGAATVSPIAGTIGSRFTSSLVTLVQYEAIGYGPWVITDTDGNAVDLSGLTLAFVVYDLVDDADEVWRLTSGDGEITVSGDDNNQVTLTDDDTHTQTAGRWGYTLWDTGNKTPLQWGILAIERSAGPTAPS